MGGLRLKLHSERDVSHCIFRLHRKAARQVFDNCIPEPFVTTSGLGAKNVRGSDISWAVAANHLRCSLAAVRLRSFSQSSDICICLLAEKQHRTSS